MITALTLSGLAVSRGARRLVIDFNLTLRAGEAVHLAGPNGSGKTTLLRAVAGLIRPDAGAVAFEGHAGPLDPDTARREHTHFAGHLDALKPGRTGREELAFAAAWTGAPPDGAARAIETLNLAPLLPLETRVLSAGQRRRLALARLVAAPRALWLLDEPLSPLDAAWRARFGELMAAHLAEGGLILAAAHDPLPVPARVVEIAP